MSARPLGVIAKAWLTAPRAAYFTSNAPQGSRCLRASASAASPSAADPPAAPSRERHNATQAEFFAPQVHELQSSITPDVDAVLAQVAGAVPGLGPASRVLDVGAGTGALIPHLQSRGVRDILALDVCPEMLEEVHRRFGSGSTLGNDPAVRTWLGDVAELPAYQGPFDAAFFNAVFGNLHDPREALLRACFLLRPGSHVVISHPLGRAWHEQFRASHPALVPHALPRQEALEALIADLPLTLVEMRDEEEGLYLALLRVPDGYSHPAAPIRLAGAIVPGFGRGSRQLGVPTANLAPAPLEAQLRGLPAGVYFGWARVDPGAGAPDADAAVHKMVMNVGRRPTFDAQGVGVAELSVEVHIMHSYAAEEFYGRPMRVVALGFIRPEVKFSGLPELLARIHADIGLARAQLDSDLWAPFRDDAFLAQA